MPPRIFGFNEDDIRRLRDAVRSLDAGENAYQRPVHRQAGKRFFKEPKTAVFGKLTSTVASIGAAGNAPTTGELNIYGVTTTGGTESKTRTVDVYNFTTEAFTTTEWVQAYQERYGKWIIDQVGGGGGSTGKDIKVGRPDTPHPTGTFREYSIFEFNSSMDLVDSGNNTTAVYQDSGEGYTTDVMHVLWEMDTSGTTSTIYWSWPIELTDCEAVNNLGSGSLITPTTTTFRLTITESFHTVGTPSSTYTTHDIRSIAPGNDGDVVQFVSENSSQNIVFKDGTSTGNLAMSGDFTLSHPHDNIGFIYQNSVWKQYTQHNNA